MVSAEWSVYFAAALGAAMAAAGLLFVSFSIYASQYRTSLTSLEQRIAFTYFLEMVTIILTSSFALLPPHWWWLGALFAGAIGTFNSIVLLREAQPYRSAYRLIHSQQKHTGKQAPHIESREVEDESQKHMAAIFSLYKSQLDKGRSFIPLAEQSLFLVFAITGMLSTFIKAIPSEIPLHIEGFMTAVFIASSTGGVWLFLQKLSERNSVVHGK